MALTTNEQKIIVCQIILDYFITLPFGGEYFTAGKTARKEKIMWVILLEAGIALLLVGGFVYWVIPKNGGKK